MTPTDDSMEPPTDPLAIVEDERFLHLWDLVNHAVVPWDEFAKLPMPPGVEPRRLWRAMSVLRQRAGNLVGRDGLAQGGSVWYNLPSQDTHLIVEAMGYLDSSSAIAAHLRRRGYRAIALGQQIEEAVASIRADGLAGDYEDAHNVITGARTPTETAGLLVKGYYDTLLEAYDSPAAALPASLPSLYSKMTRYLPGGTNRPAWRGMAPHNLEDALNAPSAGKVDALCRSAYFWGAAADIDFVAPLRHTFGSLLRRIFLVCNGMPVMSLLPMATLAPSTGQARDGSDPDDRTGDVTLYLRTAVRMAHELEDRILDEERRTQALADALLRWPAINERQARLLVSLLQDPSSQVDYALFSESFNTSYNTARSDIGGLVQGGYLYPSPVGRKVAFRAVPNLADLLATRVK